jgi:hypothetical protein
MSKIINGWKLKQLVTTLPDNRGIEWVDEAKCNGKGVDDFVYASAMPTLSQRHKLKKTCEGCPVMLTCRYEAVRNLEEGWWGGMDEQERIEWAAKELFNEDSLHITI